MAQDDEETGLVIVGAGRQGRNVADVATAAGMAILGFLDDTRPPGDSVAGISVLGGFDAWNSLEVAPRARFILAVGDNAARAGISRDIEAGGGKLASVIHPSCIVSPSARIDRGCFISGFCRVLSNAHVGAYALIEGLSTVGADAVLGDGGFMGPSAQITGGGFVGREAFIGAGAIVVGPARIGDYSVIGAGATVIADIPDRVLAVGVPAAIKRRFPVD